MYPLTKTTKNELWWLIISVDYHYSRIAIADYEINSSHIILWLEDKQDYKNTLDECLQLCIPLKCFTSLIRTEQLNSYETTKMHARKKFLYTSRIEINKPLAWYQQDATPNEQRWAREILLKSILTYLIESETAMYSYYAI